MIANSDPDQKRAPGTQAQESRDATVATALRLFASIFVREPSRLLMHELEARREELPSALGTDPLAGLDLDAPEAAEEALAVDYCQLFIGPGTHLAPVESVAGGDGRYWGPLTERVIASYAKLGFEVPEGTQVFPDHIAMELDCLALLEEQGRHAEAAAFAKEHLLRWLPALVEHVEHRAQTAFYPACAKGLLALLEELYSVDAQENLTKD